MALVIHEGSVHIEADLTPRDPIPSVGPAESSPPRIVAVAFEPASESIMTLRSDSSVAVLEPSGHTRILTAWQGETARAFVGLAVGIPGTRTEGIAYCARENGGVIMLDVASDKAVGSLDAEDSNGAPGEVLMGATPTPDGQRILATTRNGIVRFWTLEGEHLLNLRAHENWGLRMVASPSIDVAVSVSSLGSVRLWTTRSSSEAAQLRSETEPLAEPELIARMRREAAVESVLDAWPKR